jgi:XTP/dITP diphosphohydrolase
MDVVLATRNKNKVREIREILSAADSGVNVYTLDDFPDIGEIEEDGATFEENALKKAEHIAAATGIIAIADDSGLVVDALEGRPGVYSARYAGEDADDRQNNEKLLAELQGVPDDRRTARFVCCIAMGSKGQMKTFTGAVEGRIGHEPRGKSGFGYDPLFYPGGSDRTFAEMDSSEKNAISHRAVALRKLKEYLISHNPYP